MSLTAVRQQERRRERFSPTGRVALFASIVISFLAASSAPTPLYERYVALWHGTALTVTAAFAVYAGAVLVGLLTLAEVSNHVGRKPVILVAIATQAVALFLFATAGSFTPLFLGRVLQGIAAGASLGALGAGMIDADRERGTLASAAAPGAGTGAGALLAGLVVAYLPWPTHLVYLILLVVLAVQAVLVSALPESRPERTGLLRDLRPRVSVPRSARGAFAGITPALFAIWALAGLYGSLGPALVRELTGSASVALGGIALFVLAGVASAATLLLRGYATGRTVVLGIGALAAGVLGVLASIAAGSITGYLVATVIAGVGFGSGLQGAIRTVMPLARPEERAGLLSAVYLVSYVGMGAPAVAAGFLVSRGHALDHVAEGYAVVLLVLAALAAGMLVARSRVVAAEPVTD